MYSSMNHYEYNTRVATSQFKKENVVKYPGNPLWTFPVTILPLSYKWLWTQPLGWLHLCLAL